MYMTHKDAISAIKSAKRIYGSIPLTDDDRFDVRMTKKSALYVIEEMVGVHPRAFEDGIKVMVFDNGDVHLG